MHTDRELAGYIKSLMPPQKASVNKDKPVSIWKELDRIGGSVEDTIVVIFRTRGCSWYNFSSCSMCGYFNDIDSSVTKENLLRQVDVLSNSLNGIKVVKVFTSGSFLDPLEIPLDVRSYFLDSMNGRIDHLLVESRTEYLNEKNIGALGNYGYRIRVAIGLESSNDSVITNSINKGSSYSKYVTAATTARKLGFGVRTYLLFKPPFYSEKFAIEDMLSSIRDTDGYSDDVSVNPMNIQKNTLVEHLWKKNLYRPPRLWSLARILLDSRKPGRTVISYPTGGNHERGVHNNDYDRKLLDLIVSSSLNQDFSELEEYYNSADLSSYNEDIELEDRLPSGIDVDLLSRRSISYSQVI